MKVLQVSEVTSSIDLIIRKKEEEKKHFHSIRDAINKVTELDDTLKGDGGNAIREHFTILHLPVLLLFEQFIDNYIEQLNQIKGSIDNYESSDGLVREDFIEQDVKNGITKIEQLTLDVVDNINGHLRRINDLVHPAPVNPTQFHTLINQSKQHMEKTIEELRELDENNKSKLDPPADELHKTQQFIGKIDGWTKDGIFLSEKEIKEVGEALQTDTLQKMIEEYGLGTLLRNTTISFAGAIMNSGKLLKTGEINFKMFKKKDGTIYLKIKDKEIEKYLDNARNGKLSLRDYEKYRKLFTENLGGRWKWNRDFITELIKDGKPLYDENGHIWFRKNSSKFTNSQFDDLSNYINRLDDSFASVAVNTFKDEMKVWESFQGWKGASNLTKLGKGAGILGIGFDVYDNATSNFYNEKTGKWEYTGGKQVKKFAVDTTVDIGAGAAAMAAGAAAGSFFLPPAGTVVGAFVGAGAYVAINYKIPYFKPPQSLVDLTKNMANSAVDKVGEYANKAAEEIGDCVESVGKKLDKIFW